MNEEQWENEGGTLHGMIATDQWGNRRLTLDGTSSVLLARANIAKLNGETTP